MRRVLVTGATGLVGSAVVAALVQQNKMIVRVAVHRPGCFFPPSSEVVDVGKLSSGTDWETALRGVDCVVHCAAKTSSAGGCQEESVELFRAVNVEASLNLAQQAAAFGVRRFLFVSTAKVHGEHSSLHHPFDERSAFAPLSGYARSKVEAEQGLWQVASTTGLELVVVRPPLVYGKGAGGNLQRLFRWLDTGIPLPMGSVHNRRSLVGLDNLVDFLVLCLDHPAAAGQTFLVSDGEDLSLPGLLRRIGKIKGAPVRLFPVPVRMLEKGASLLGRQAMATRLLCSFQVDTGKARTLLHWTPPLSVEDGLKQCFSVPTQDQDRRLIRVLDAVFSALGLILGSPLLLVLTLLGTLDTGSPILRQKRMGRGQTVFTLYKFRTMKCNTPTVGTHLVDAAAITRFGRLLRKTKLDELPQLWNVLKGEMSLVGPRPCLPTQLELIHERELLGVFSVRPGVTGLAQIQGVDMSTPKRLAEVDAKMIHKQSLLMYFSCIIQTAVGAGSGDCVVR